MKGIYREMCEMRKRLKKLALTAAVPETARAYRQGYLDALDYWISLIEDEGEAK